MTRPEGVSQVPERAASVDEVVGLLARWGTHRYDEVVSQIDHALQTAALARRDGATDELVAAALLHDVGHLLEIRDGADAYAGPSGDVEDLRHEERGAAWLSGLFPSTVTGPVALHVAAKRYRCAVDPSEVTRLSAGSIASLERQGGPMSGLEVSGFEADVSHADAVVLRGWDDAGKVVGLDVPPLDTYRDLLEGVARG